MRDVGRHIIQKLVTQGLGVQKTITIKLNAAELQRLNWEKVGQVPNVVFVEGMARKNDRYLFYYGAADEYVGVAEAAMMKWLAD